MQSKGYCLHSSSEPTIPSVMVPTLILLCAICGKRIVPEKVKTDESGEPVHEECCEQDLTIPSAPCPATQS